MIRTALILLALTVPAVAQDVTATKRADFAKRHERQMLSLGHDMYVSTAGAANKVYLLRFAGIDRPFVHQWANDSPALNVLTKLGFEQAELSNGQTVWRFHRSGTKWIAENPTASQQ